MVAFVNLADKDSSTKFFQPPTEYGLRLNNLNVVRSLVCNTLYLFSVEKCELGPLNTYCHAGYFANGIDILYTAGFIMIVAVVIGHGY